MEGAAALAALLGWGALKGGLLLALAAALALALRNARAAVRHAVWAGALAAALALPVLDALGPAWRLAILPASPAVPAPARATAAAIGAGLDWFPLLVLGGWLLGAVCVSGRWLAGTLSAYTLARRTAPLTDPAWRADAARIARSTGMRAPVELRLSRDLRSPVVWGLWRPLLLLPAEATAWPDERRAAVLAHELAHIRRRDCLTGFVAQAACAIHWFNPLAWIAYRRLLVERERACDDGVLRGGLLASRYASHLVAVAREAGREPRAARAALALARRSEMEERVRAMLDGRPRGGPLSGAGVTLLSAAALGAAAFLGAIEPVHRAAPVASEAVTALAADPMPAVRPGEAVTAPIFLPEPVGAPAPARRPRAALRVPPQAPGRGPLASVESVPAPEGALIADATAIAPAKPRPMTGPAALAWGSTPPRYVPAVSRRGVPSGPMASEEPRYRVRVVRVQSFARPVVPVVPPLPAGVWAERADEAHAMLERPALRLVPPSVVAAEAWAALGVQLGEAVCPDSGRTLRVEEPGAVHSDSGHGVDLYRGRSYRRTHGSGAPRGNRRGTEAGTAASSSSPASR